EGIPTKRFTFLKEDVVLSRTITERNSGTSATGKIRTEVVEVFNGTPTSDIGGVQIGDEESNVDGIPTRRYTFVLGEGEIRTSTRPGPVNIPGTQYVTVESVGTAVTPTGTLVAESEDNENGYIKYVKTALQGTITGTKQTYKDVVEVDVPGTVNCATVSVSAGGESGTIAVPQVTPAKTKRVAATVTVEVTDNPPNTASLAYDIGAISCSVTSTNVQLSEGPGVTVSAGTTAVVTQTGYVKNFSASSRIQTYPGCYLTSSSSTGSISYTSSSTPRVSGNVISSDTATSTRQTKCIGTGASGATGYATTGIIKRQSRPILTTLDGTTYYEVITWSV
ncbi:MAG: hypothetical protein ACPGII_08195, partial [Opitutales bacterium]